MVLFHHLISKKYFRICALLVVVSCAFMTAVLFAGASSAINGTVGGRPANPDSNNLRTSSIFIYTTEAGKSAQDAVTVVNSTDKTQTVELYVVDAAISNTGAFTCKQRVEAASGVGSWIALSSTEVSVPAQSKKNVDFSLNVPESSDVGEHNGCIIIQPKNDDGEVVGNVRIRTRSAIRVAVTIPGDLRKNVTIDEYTIDVSGESQKYYLKLKNTGNVSADIDSKVELKNIFGGLVYKNGGGYPIIANNILELRFSNAKHPFWGGWYTASASISYDKEPGSFGTVNKNNLITKRAENKIVYIAPHPIATGIYTILLIALLAGVILLYRRRTIGKNWHHHTVKQNETLESIAQDRSTSWKKLARANNLHAPYGIHAGDKLKVPKRTKRD